jgi:hypothetical protein
MVFFGGALIGFCLARTMMLSPANVRDKTVPGEWFWYSQRLYKPNIFLHIYGSIIGGILVVFQFVPAIRRRAITFHRLNGYLVVLLVLASTLGGSIVARRAFGGEINVQSAFYVLGSLASYALIMGIVNRLETRKHRKWMLRAVTYFSVPITARIIMVCARQIVSDIGSYYSTWRCDEVLSVLRDVDALNAKYPQCAGISNLSSVHVAVHAATRADRLSFASSVRVTFGMALWLSLVMHIIGVEFYIRATESMNKHRRGFVLERSENGFLKATHGDR